MTEKERQKQIDAAITQQMASDPIKAQIAARVEAQMASDEIKATIENATEAKIQELINENMNSEEVQKQLHVVNEKAYRNELTGVKSLFPH